jgi:PAS domain S-box-containing protein
LPEVFHFLWKSRIFGWMSMRVGELARRTGVGSSTLRAWERRFRFLEPQRSPAGHRLYDETDVERVEAVLRVVAEGLTLPAAIARVASVGTAALPAAGEGQALLYKQILEAVGQGVWVVRDLRTRYVNRRMAEIMRSSVEELVAIPILELFKPDELSLVKERSTVARGGHRLHFAQEIRRPDGSTFMAEVNTTPLFNQAGRYEGAVALVKDVTNSSETPLVGTTRDETETNRRAADLRTREQQSETLALLGVQALRLPTLVVTEAVEATRRLLQADHARVLEVIGGTNELQVRDASPPLPSPIAVPSGSRSFAGYTALARKAVVVGDARLDGRFDMYPTHLGGPAVAMIGAPIFGPEGVHGALIAESSAVNRFDACDGHFIQAMANVVGTALLSSGVDGVTAR